MIVAAKIIDSVSSPVFTCGQQTVVPESQFHFDQPDPAVAGNVMVLATLQPSQYQKAKCKIGQ